MSMQKSYYFKVNAFFFRAKLRVGVAALFCESLNREIKEENNDSEYNYIHIYIIKYIFGYIVHGY